MRAGWQEKKLGEVLTLEYGKPLPPAERKADGKYAVYGANGIKDRSDRFYSDKQSIIVGRKGSAGEITLTEDRFWPLDVTYFVDFDEAQYDLQFLYHLLSLQELSKLAKGVKPGINRNEVYAKTVRVTPLFEQQRIVAILDEAFAGLATATANAEKNLKNARELFDARLKHVFRSQQEGWSGKKLGEVCALITDGKHGDCTNKNNSGYYFLSAKDIKNGTLNYEGARQITKAEFEETHRRTNLEPGDILVTNAGTIGRVAIAPSDERTRRTTFQKSVAVLKVMRSLADSSFCAYNLVTSLIDLQSLSAGTAQKNLLLRDLRSFPFWMPSLSKQKAIVAELDEFSGAIRRLENLYREKLEFLESLKQSILQKAFLGELTSPPAQVVKEAAE